MENRFGHKVVGRSGGWAGRGDDDSVNRRVWWKTSASPTPDYLR
jgi:hypothetical protein